MRAAVAAMAAALRRPTAQTRVAEAALFRIPTRIRWVQKNNKMFERILLQFRMKLERGKRAATRRKDERRRNECGKARQVSESAAWSGGCRRARRCWGGAARMGGRRAGGRGRTRRAGGRVFNGTISVDRQASGRMRGRGRGAVSREIAASAHPLRARRHTFIVEAAQCAE